VLEATWPILVAEPVGVDEAADTELVLLDLVVDEAADTELVLLDIAVDVALVPVDELAGFALHLIPGIKNMFLELITTLTVNCSRILPRKHFSSSSSYPACLLLLRQ
jgi:hypothetical protein